MRTIKFRAWDESHKTMIQNYAHVGTDGNMFIAYTASPLTLIPLQFTGLLDKNGKEIYEGDIVKGCLRGIGIRELEVKFNPTQGFYPLQGEGFDNFRSDCEVIGNTYENPELLK